VKHVVFDWYAHSLPKSRNSKPASRDAEPQSRDSKLQSRDSKPDPNLKHSPVVLALPPCESIDFSPASLCACAAGRGISKKPFTVRPRDYLSFLTILLI
jgi:hypothetical protein